MKYRRFIEEKFVKALNDVYQKEPDGWWARLLADREIFLAFRQDALNAYYRGCSVARISLEGREVCAQTHYKYLLKPSMASPMIVARGGTFVFPSEWQQHAGGPFIEMLTDLDAIKRAAKPFAGGEKKFVAEVIGKNPNVFDVEIALTRDADEEEVADGKREKLADRIDLAALSRTASGLELVFYEAKLFGNKELRASGEAEAPVVRQVKKYESLLEGHLPEVRESAIRTAENVLALDGFSPQRKFLAAAIKDAAGAFSINAQPILVLGGFDADQKKDGSVWSGHHEKLLKALPGRVIAKGGAASIRLGKWPA